MRKYILIIIGSLFAISLNAQYINQGLTMSQDMVSGSARYVGMAGAFNSLGGDFTGLINNPAGLGVYRSSELSFSLGFNKSKANSNYLGENTNSFDRTFDSDHFGYVSVFEAGDSDKSGFKYYNFGFGYNKLADYSGFSVVQGTNSNNSIMDNFALNANGIHYNNLSYEYDIDGNEIYNPFFDSNVAFETIMAWNTFLIDTAANSTDSYLNPLYAGDVVLQTLQKTTAGDKGEYNFSFATNYNNVLFIGASMGVQRVFYSEISTYSEEYISGTTDFDALDYKTDQSIQGTGINAKVGIIYKPIKSLRIGASIQSPTFYSMNYDYDISMDSYFYQGDSYSSGIDGYNSYSFETPMKANFGASYIINKLGLISVDYEMVDYSSMRYSKGLGGDNFIDLNSLIQENYTVAHNLRAGAEVRLGLLSIRGGFANYSSPLKNANGGFMLYSGGLGLKFGSLNLDVAYAYRDNASQIDRLYEIDDLTPSNYDITTTNTQLLFTLGFRF